MRRLFLFLAVGVAVSGCAVSKRPADPKVLSELAGQTITYQALAPSSFVFVTPQNSKVPIARVALMVKDGTQLIEENQLVDPAQNIARTLATELERVYQARLVAPPPVQSPPAATPDSASVPARFSVNVTTTNWGLFFSTKQEGKYGVIYTARVEVMDLAQGSVIASAPCLPNRAEALTSTILLRPRQEMLDNQAAGLKAALDSEARKCIDMVKAQVLAM